MEMQADRLRKYSGISLGAVLAITFVLAQPTMNQAYAVGIAGDLSGYDDCQFINSSQPEDPISMNTVRSGNIAKTIHAEKEIFDCDLDQGGLSVIVDVTTYIEIYENIVDREVLQASALVTTCLKNEDTAVVIDCESYIPPTVPVPVDPSCTEAGYITHPQEMNTVNKGRIAKTIEAQKEVFNCYFAVYKKVDIVSFTSVYEDLTDRTVTDVQFYAMRCVVLESDFDDDRRDATVESCKFSIIPN